MAAAEERTELARVVKSSVHRMLGEESKTALRMLDLANNKVDKRGQRVTAYLIGRDYWLIRDDFMPGVGPAHFLHSARINLEALLAVHDTVAQKIVRLRELGAMDSGLWNTWIHHHGEGRQRIKRALQMLPLAVDNANAASEPIRVALTLPYGSAAHVERVTAARDRLQWAAAFGIRAHNEVRLLRRALVRVLCGVEGTGLSTVGVLAAPGLKSVHDFVHCSDSSRLLCGPCAITP